MTRSAMSPALAANAGFSRVSTTITTTMMAMVAPMTPKRPVSPVSCPVKKSGTMATAGSTNFVPTVTMPLAATDTVDSVVE
jgi:hypothetical protein